MIVNSLKKSLLQIIFSPWVLLPFIAVTLLTFLITSFFTDIIQKPVIDLVLNYESLAQSNLLFVLLTQYPLEILTILLVGFFGLVVSSMALLVLAKISKGKGFVDAVDDTIMGFGKAISLSIFLVAGLIVLIGVLYVLSIVINFLAQLFPSISIILGAIIFPILFIAILGLLLVKFSFIIPALVDQKLKKALQKSWDFSNNRFFSALLLIIILLIIGFFIGIISEYIMVILNGQFESVILTGGEIISATFFGLTIANYFYSD